MKKYSKIKISHTVGPKNHFHATMLIKGFAIVARVPNSPNFLFKKIN
jgi:hypothetical protein